MNHTLRKPLRTSSSLSSGILRMYKVVEIDGAPTGPIGEVCDLPSQPGWIGPLLGQIGQEVAILRAGGTPYAHLRRKTDRVSLLPSSGG